MDLSKATYLILEDNKIDQMVLIDLLEELHVQSESINCSPSLKEIPNQHYDFILSDLNIYDSNKLDTVKSVSLRFPDSIIIVLTGMEDLDLATEAIQCGAQDYLIKGEINSFLLKKTLLFAFERNSMAKQIKMNEARFRGLIERNYDGILIMDEETIVSYASPSVKSITCFEADQLLGKKITNFLHPEDKPKRASLFKKLVNKEIKFFSNKQRIQKKDGSYIWVEITVSDQREVPGVCGFVSNIKNIDQEEQAIEQLRQSEQRLVEITDTVPGIVLRYKLNTDGTDQLLFLSKGPAELSDLRKEIKDDFKPFWRIVFSEDVTPLKDSILESAKKLTLWNHRFRLIAGSRIIWMNGIGTPTSQKDGSVIWDSILFDITDQVNMEHALKESHERFELVSKATNDAIWDWNLLKNKVYLGRGFENLFGYKLKKAVADKNFLFSKIHPKDKRRVLEDLYEKTLNNSLTYWRDEFRFIKQCGNVAYVYCQAIIVYNKNNVPVRIVGAMQDITQQKKLFYDITERNKEITCLFTVSQILNDSQKSIPEILIELVKIIPQSLKYPDSAGCKVKLSGETYRTTSLKETDWKLKSDIVINNETVGFVELQYNTIKPNEDEGPFLKEERGILDTIAHFISNMIEKRRAEEELQKERLLLRTLIDNIPDRIYVKDKELKYIVNNKANVKFIGAKNEQETLNKTSLDFFGDLAGEFHKVDMEVLKSGKIYTLSDHNVTSKGIVKCFHTIKAPFIDPKGEILGVVGISRDITKSKESEEKLKESEANLKAIFNNTDVGYVLIDKDYKILSLNRKAYHYSKKYHAVPLEVGDNLIAGVEEHMKPLLKLKLEEVFENKFVDIDKEYHNNGLEEYYKIAILPVKIGSNNVVGACIGINNLTMIKQAEKKIEKTAASMRALLNSTEDSFILVDKHFKIKSFNKQAVKNAKGLEKKFHVSDNILDFVPEPKDAMKMALIKALSGQKVEYMQSFNTSDGEVSLHVKVNPIFSQYSAEVDEVSIVIRNITDRKIYERMLILQQQLLLNTQQLANLGSLEWDLRNDMFYATGDFFQLFNIKPDREDIKNEFFNRIDCNDRKRIEKSLKMAIKNQSPFSLEFKTVPINEVQKYIKGKGIVSSNNMGIATKVFCALQDITEQKNADQAMLLGQELERGRLARDLHDDVGQLLTATKFRLEAIETENNLVLAEQIGNVKDLISTTIKEVRAITKNLSTKILEQHGLEAAIGEVCRPLYESDNIKVEFNYNVHSTLDHNFQLSVYRIVQESINNIMKHAFASKIRIEFIEKTNFYILTVADNGIGLDVKKLGHNKGNGIYNIRERTNLLKGSFEIDSRLNEGTKILCKFPK